jgi:hypothetical protein
MNISKNFTLEELCASATAKAQGINNMPDTGQTVNLCALVHNVLQPLRDAMGPITIASGFRSYRLNQAVGGVEGSQHMKGEAADIFIKGDKEYGRKLFKWIMDNCDFDQLIWEHNSKGTYWVHVSYKVDGKNRRHVISNLLKQ